MVDTNPADDYDYLVPDRVVRLRPFSKGIQDYYGRFVEAQDAEFGRNMVTTSNIRFADVPGSGDEPAERPLGRVVSTTDNEDGFEFKLEPTDDFRAFLEWRGDDDNFLEGAVDYIKLWAKANPDLPVKRVGLTTPEGDFGKRDPRDWSSRDVHFEFGPSLEEFHAKSKQRSYELWNNILAKRVRPKSEGDNMDNDRSTNWEHQCPKRGGATITVAGVANYCYSCGGSRWDSEPPRGVGAHEPVEFVWDRQYREAREGHERFALTFKERYEVEQIVREQQPDVELEQVRQYGADLRGAMAAEERARATRCGCEWCRIKLDNDETVKCLHEIIRFGGGAGGMFQCLECSADGKQLGEEIGGITYTYKPDRSVWVRIGRR